MHRPEFISQSRQRVKRLAQQAEERKLQEVFSRERGELFGRPGGPGRLPKPAGTHQETAEGGYSSAEVLLTFCRQLHVLCMQTFP